MQKLKYPVIFVHGMGARDDMPILYWGRIPDKLASMGIPVFYADTDSSAPIKENAIMLRKRILSVLRKTGARKVNLIAHSKGGLDSRYAITHLGMDRFVASLTTMSTPHHGSKTMDWIMRLPKPLMQIGSWCADGIFTLLGDKKADTYAVLRSFTTAAAAEFNKATPDMPSVYYQSYAFVMRSPFSDLFMALPCLIVALKEGENDGLLPPATAVWGDFRGICRGNGHQGISHCDEVDFRRRRLTGKTGTGVSDVIEVYLDAVRQLAKKGF